MNITETERRIYIEYSHSIRNTDGVKNAADRSWTEELAGSYIA